MKGESTRSLVIGLFVVTGRSELSAAELVQLAKCRGVTASNLKSHLTRMVQDGSLVRRGGRRSFLYSPSPAKQRMIAAIKTRIGPAKEPWNGEWLMLVPRLPTDRARRERARRRLTFDGFRPLGPGAFARPAWPLAWARERADAHVERHGGVYVIGAMLGTRAHAELVRSYAIESLSRRADRLRQRVERALVTTPLGGRALALQLRLGEQIARLYSLDPRLPPELWGGRSPLVELARAHSRLERVLARASAPFLATVLADARRTARTA